MRPLPNDFGEDLFILLLLLLSYNYYDLQIDDRRLTDCSMMLSRLILPSRPLANELCSHVRQRRNDIKCSPTTTNYYQCTTVT